MLLGSVSTTTTVPPKSLDHAGYSDVLVPCIFVFVTILFVAIVLVFRRRTSHYATDRAAWRLFGKEEGTAVLVFLAALVVVSLGPLHIVLVSVAVIAFLVVTGCFIGDLRASLHRKNEPSDLPSGVWPSLQPGEKRIRELPHAQGRTIETVSYHKDERDERHVDDPVGMTDYVRPVLNPPSSPQGALPSGVKGPGPEWDKNGEPAIPADRIGVPTLHQGPRQVSFISEPHRAMRFLDTVDVPRVIRFIVPFRSEFIALSNLPRPVVLPDGHLLIKEVSGHGLLVEEEMTPGIAYRFEVYP